MPIINPVLPGFHPDPSFIRVGDDDFYLANSTFEWFPGVPIYHSKDLAHWRLVGHGLTRRSQLDMLGVPDSGGIWAPSLSYDNGTFYLIYTIVRTKKGPFKDVHNYVVTAPAIEGPWSEPSYLNSSGFDPSLFHDDDDGRKWYVNQLWDHRKGNFRFNGIVLQEFDAKSRKLIGPVKQIIEKRGVLVEGPNLYKRDGWYYCMMAEGGTGWNHGISMARSRKIDGPYELDPQPLVITSKKSPGNPLQKAGHGELVETKAGEWCLAHLASRPTYPSRRCVLGRETCLQKVVWDDAGWLRLASGGTDAQVEVESPRGLPEVRWPEVPPRDDFDGPELRKEWCALRVPIDESWASLKVRPGWLTLFGRESLHSLFEQSLLARRLQSFRATAETCMEFEPVNYGQSAGLVAWYNTRCHYYLRVTHDERRGKVLGLFLTDDGVHEEYFDKQIDVNDWPRYYLRAAIDDDTLQFSASPDGKDWQNVGGVLDMTKLSDDYGVGGNNFTGAFIGVRAHDLNGTRVSAHFDHFTLS